MTSRPMTSESRFDKEAAQWDANPMRVELAWVAGKANDLDIPGDCVGLLEQMNSEKASRRAPAHHSDRCALCQLIRPE